jgi:peptide/nickel transport system substrate-binding protein
MLRHRPPLRTLSVALLLLSALAACWARVPGQATGDEIVLNLPIRAAGPGSLDPVRGSTTYDNQACSLVYETLLQYRYLKRPLELEPLLLQRMPLVAEDGLTWSFELRDDILFQDDECFESDTNPDGTGRQMVAEDVIYSWKRIADKSIGTKNWWLVEDTIAGFDEWRDERNRLQAAAEAAGEEFDFYDSDVPGMRVTDKLSFEVELAEPVSRFAYVLAMFQLSVVPREAVEFYSDRFPRKPVGSGPYELTKWQNSLSLTYEKNPTYRPDFYPTDTPKEREAADIARGLHDDAGKRLPFADRINIRCYVQDQPMWLEFRSGVLDYAQIPAENFVDAINKRTKSLRPKYKAEGLTYHPVPLLDFIFRGFNCDEQTSEFLGGYGDSPRKLRQAISLATDFGEFNETFYNGQNIVYDGMIPPKLAGHPEGHFTPAAYTGPDLDRARRLLVEAGYPNGEGLPVLDYYISQSANSQEQSEMTRRQLAAIGIKVNPILLEFAQLIDAIDKRTAPMFSFAWGSDYPDGENNLALFYGPNQSPSSNHYNYENAEYDRLYEQIRTMLPSPERDRIYEQMRDMVLEDAAFIGSMARTRNYLGTKRLKNFKPTEDFWNWPKYLTLDHSAGSDN